MILWEEMEKIITSLRICKIIKDLKGNDTLRGDGKTNTCLSHWWLEVKLKGNDTLRGDGNAYLSANGKASNN